MNAVRVRRVRRNNAEQGLGVRILQLFECQAVDACGRGVAADAALLDGWCVGWKVEGQLAGIGGVAQPFYRRIGQNSGMGNDGNAGKMGF